MNASHFKWHRKAKSIATPLSPQIFRYGPYQGCGCRHTLPAPTCSAEDRLCHNIAVRRYRRRLFLDYVLPTDLLNDAIQTTSRKASLSVRDLLIRSFLAGGLLAYATPFVFIVLVQNIDPIVVAILLLA